MITTFHFVRHGHVHNPKNVVYGRLPRFTLSKEGLKQAESTADALASKPIRAVFSSPMLRARKTAEVIASRHAGVKVQVSQNLIEVHTSFDGRPIEEMEKINWEFYRDVQPPYETPWHIFQRTQQFIQKMRKRYPGEEIVAVTHGDTVCFLIAWLSGMEITGETKLRISAGGMGYPATASITSLKFQTNAPGEIPPYEYRVPYMEGAK